MVEVLVQACKNLILPKGKRFRKLRFGLASGCVMNIDFKHSTNLYLGLYEKEVEPYFRSLLHKGDHCFDVGGKGGYDALIIAKLTGSKVVSFECEDEAAEEMRQTFAQNPFPIQTVQTFVGDQDDDTHTTLDAAALQTFTPDFIKLDIEGAEVKALLGAADILSKRKPSLIIEVHGQDEERQCLEILSTHGYTPTIVNQRDWRKENRPLEHNRWLVCCGRKRETSTPRAKNKAGESNAIILPIITVGLVGLAFWAVLEIQQSKKK